MFNNSWFLYFKNSKPSISYYDRSCAYSIRPVLIEDENLSTEVTDEDLANAWTDEYGVKYSQDKRRLLACNLGELLWNEWSWEYTIRKETKVICDNAFAFSKSSYHNGETFVTLPDGLISIGHFAFMGLSLKSIIIPKSTTAIANDAFVNTVHLSSIVVDKRNHVFDSRNNCNAIIETKSNTLVVGCASTIIPSNIIKIGSNAFYGCINLKSISLPNSVVSIEDFAFYGCEGLKQFSLPNDIKSIGESAFDFNYLFLPDSILHIGNGYSNCRLKRFYANKETQKRILDIHPEYSCLFDDSVSTKYDFNNALEDEFGAKYSSDKRCLLSVPIGLKEYMIKEGTEIICNYAFVGGSYNDLKKMALIHKKVNAESIVLPNSINTIGKYALSGCNNLQSIVIPIGTKEKFEELLPDYKDKFVEQVDEENLSTEVTEEDLANAWIDEFGVKYSADKKRLLMAPKEIAKYTIIEGTTIICNSAFERCSLTSVTIPNSIKVIGKNAFQGCFDLAAIELPDDLLIIADYAFDMCHSVKSIVLPSSVKFMGCGAFCDMRGLSSLKVDEKNQNFDSRNHCDAIIRTKDNVLIRGCSNTVIPSTVSCIGDSAFSGCDTLCSITIPNSIKSIGKYAFENCELLCSIEIPDSIVTIEDYAFDNCYSLKTISLPSSISKIGYMPFNECGVLSQIVIPKGTKHKFEKLLLKYKDKIVEQGGDENLSTEVTDEDLVNAWTDEYGVKYSADRKRLLKAPTEIRRYSVRNGTKIICNKAFQSTLLAQVIIPNSVLCIGDDAFGGCCLTSIEIPENVQSIGERAFSYNALNSVTIPQNVKHIGKGAFGSCGSLICIIVNKENKFYDSRNDCNAIIETKSNTLIVGCQNTIIPNNVKSVGEWAFTGCCNLSFIFIPKEVLMIGQRAFNGCERLKKISVDKDNEFFDSRNDCNAIIETKTNTLIVGCKNTIIPNSVKTIGEWAFSGCNKLSAINIPESVLSINEGAFSGCSDLSNVELPKGLKELGCRVFSDSGIESIIIPDGIEVISESLFNCCRNLISVNLPNSVTTIENYAFSQCRPLSSISMSDNVITIGDWAFACCSSLASIELSNSIQIIGKGAFYDCESLRTFFIPLGLKTKFEVLLPAYKDKLVER